MKTAGRDLTNYQWRLVANAYDHCTLPIFCKLVFQEVCRWKSYYEPAVTVLRHNVMDSVFQLFERVENKHGWLLVSHALSYITAAKNGVSEPEIEDFISLDDKVRVSRTKQAEELTVAGAGRHLPVPLTPQQEDPPPALDQSEERPARLPGGLRG